MKQAMAQCFSILFIIHASLGQMGQSMYHDNWHYQNLLNIKGDWKLIELILFNNFGKFCLFF